MDIMKSNIQHSLDGIIFLYTVYKIGISLFLTTHEEIGKEICLRNVMRTEFPWLDGKHLFPMFLSVILKFGFVITCYDSSWLEYPCICFALFPNIMT